MYCYYQVLYQNKQFCNDSVQEEKKEADKMAWAERILSSGKPPSV